MEDGKLELKKGINLFNEGSFFEAHDYFEEMWMEANRENREFYQGFVQVSVGHYHLICENYEGALSQLSKGVEKLEKYSDNFENINLAQFRQNINSIIKQISVFFSKKNYKLKVVNKSFIKQFENKT